MGIMNGLTFGGVNSLDYGIFISGEAVYNAPVRDVEAIAVPGRNGDIILDKGRFQNIEVEYPAGTFGDDSDDFSAKLSEFRNAILSQVGYQRLEDTYHPDEYRMGVYADGLEVDPVQYNSAGEFKLKFNCKPQRWLTSGETAVTVADGGTINNPTLFESSPLLEVEGYGNIEFNGFDIEIISKPLGLITLVSYDTKNAEVIDNSLYRSGDSMSIGECSFSANITFRYEGGDFGTISVTSSNPNYATSYDIRNDGDQIDQLNVNATITNLAITAGTAKTENSTITISGNYESTPFSLTMAIGIAYTPSTANDTITFSNVATIVTQGEIRKVNASNYYRNITVDSTETTIGNPVYIDCDIGECYKIKSGSIIPLNAYIDLGSDLPTLASGTNTFNYDNTVTDLKVVPRWWRV